jgi:TRAP-type C4-dicarboxylate transport system substrate-binding protein
MKEMRKGAEEIAARTEDRVKIKLYPGGVMGDDTAILRKMRIGQLQGGALTGGGLAQVYVDSQIYTLPFLFRSYDEVDYIRQRMDGLIAEGLEREGYVVLGVSEGGFAYIMSKEPLTRVEDFKGRKVWIPEGDVISETVFKTAGITPIPLPVADVYTGLQTGLLDTVGSSAVATIAFQWHTRVKYLTDVPLIYLVGFLALDAKAFGRLSPADRAVVREVLGQASQRMDRQTREDDANARRALEAQGIEAVTPSAQELLRWHEIADQAMAKLASQGVYTSAMYDTLERHLKAFRTNQGDNVP